MLSKRNAFGTWLLVGLTLGIYALVMFERLNRELNQANGSQAFLSPEGKLQPTYPPRPAWSRWWSQIIPIYGIVALHKTAQAVNTYAGHKVISPTAAWLFWSWFFVGTYPYLQIGANRAEDRMRFARARAAAEAGRG